MPDLRAPNLYRNRELSWLEYDARILAEAESESVPLLERLKFHAIFAANMDEFFMVRVAGLKQQLAGDVEEVPPDGMTPSEQLARIAERAHDLMDRQMRSLHDDVFPKLASQGISIRKAADDPEPLDKMFDEELFPILTPIAIDPGHPFPLLRNKSLNLGVTFRTQRDEEPQLGVVQVPGVFPRLIEIERGKFVLIEDLIARHMKRMFPTAQIESTFVFRVTRNFDIEVDEEDAADLLQTIQQELRRRDRGAAVRLEIGGTPPEAALEKLVTALKLDAARDVYRSLGMLNVADLMEIAVRTERRDLRDESFTPTIPQAFRETEDFFATIRESDLLLHHPYDSFDVVVDMITRAADDPNVLAIKQTLYRTGGDSPIVRALARAAESGKQVTALVELKARFDEESNIVWARTLEQSGVHVVYGVLGLKTHAKCLLVLRRERDGLQRYVHLGTGNYNLSTAKHYADISLVTADPRIGEDTASLFNLLTGYASPRQWNALSIAPLGLKERVIALIDEEAKLARAGMKTGIVAKMNALVDRDVIEALYRASIAGVPIQLLVRGICCLIPGVPEVSEHIWVQGIVDRYLEHSRIVYFQGQDKMFLSSADWMPRNFTRRVEVMAPIENPSLKARLVELLEICAADDTKSWTLDASGTYVRREGGTIRAQQRFIELAREKQRSEVERISVHPSTRFPLARR